MVKVALIMLDGLRPDAFNQGYTATLDNLCRTGAYTLKARSVVPSITLPCHMSIFHSVPPQRHGITTNIWSPMARPLPGIIDHLSDLHTAFFHSWEPLRNLNAPEALNFSYYYHPETDDYLNYDRKIVEVASDYIQSDLPDFAFIYFYSIDMAGHDFGWMSPEYLETTSRVDELLSKLLDAIPDDYTTIILSDHGGHERSHGTEMPEDMTTPIIIKGRNIKANHQIEANLSLLDIAPTVVKILGRKAHNQWEGQCPEEIFITE